MAKNSTLKSAQKAYKKGQKARANAKKKGVVTSQRPEQKKKVQPKPKAKTPTTTTQKTSPKPSVSTPSKPRTLTPKLPTTNVTQQINSYKKSSYAPKVTNTSKPSTNLESAQKAFDTYQQRGKEQKKNKVVGTEKPQNISNKISDQFKVGKGGYEKALEKSSGATYLGTKQKDVTVDLATKKQRKKQTEAQQKQFYKSDDWKETKSQLKQANQKQWRDYLRKELGWSKDRINEWMESEEGKQYRKDTYTEMKDSVKTDINKSIKEGVDKATTLKSVDALTRGEFDKMVTASALGKDLGNKYLKSVGGKKLKEKIGSKTIEAGLRSEGAYGVMQGMSKGDIFSGSVGSYNEGARTGMQQIKDSGAYNVGYGVGMAADMMMGGVASRGVSLAEGTGRLASNIFGKGISKTAAKEAAEEYVKLTKSGVLKTLGKNRAGELLAETPTNILDAAKMSLDADGNLNKDEFKKWMLINSGLTVGMGGVMEGIGAGLSKRLSNKTIELLGKKEAGNISKEESEQLDKYIDKLTQKTKGEGTLSSKIAEDALVESRRVDNQLQYMQAGKGTGTPNTPNVTKGEGTFYTRGGRQTVKEASDENQARLAKAREEATIRENARKPEKATTPEQIEARKEVAEKHGRNVADPTETARLNEVRRLQENVRRLRSELDDAEKRVKNDNTMGGHAKAVAERDEIKKALEIREKQLARANSETLSGRYSKALDNVKKDNTLQGHTKASKDLEKVEAELKADSERKIRKKKLQNAVKKAEEMVEKDPSPENKAKLEVAREAMEKVEAETKASEPPSRIDEIDRELQDIHDQQANLKNDSPESKEKLKELNLKAKSLNAEKKELLENNGQEPGHRFASVDEDDIDFVNNSKPKETSRPQISKENAYQEFKKLDAAKKTPEEKAKVKEADKKLSKQKGGLKSLWNTFYNNFVSDMAPFERMAMSAADRADRKAGRVAINKMLTARSKALEKIRSEGEKIFTDRNLHMDAVKAEAYDTYAFLDHDLDRMKQKWITVINKEGETLDIDFGNLTEAQRKRYIKENGVEWNFSDMSAEDIGKFCEANGYKWEGVVKDKSYSGLSREEIGFVMDDIVDKYGKDVQKFQKDLVKYFHDLLEMDYESGVISKEQFETLERKYPNYVPAFRDKDVDAIVSALPQENIDAVRLYEARGSDNMKDVLPLYTQMVAKTNLVVKRAAENEMLQTIAKINQMDIGDLPHGHTPEELMEVTTGTYRKITGEHMVYFRENGVGKSLEISEEGYHALRRWSGVEKAAIMEYKLFQKTLGNPKLEKGASLFKAFITDYSIIFGARNFVRDSATALVYSERPTQWLRSFPKAVMSLLPEDALKHLPGNAAKEAQMYKRAFKQYVKDGGRYNTLVTSTDLTKSVKAGKKDGIPGLRIIKDFNTALETLPRMSEYIASVERLAKQNNVSFDEALKKSKITDEAMYNAKEVTLNFDRAGQYGRILNRGAVPFFNPAIQGADKLIRVLATDNKSLTEFMEMGAKMGGMVVAPALAWEYFIGQNEDYQKLSAYNKYTYFCIPMGKNDDGDPVFIKIPRAREMAALQLPMEWFIQNVKFGTRDGAANLFESAKQAGKLAFEQIGPINPLSDNFLSPAFNLMRNKDWMGYNVESREDLDKRALGNANDIYDSDTSTAAVTIQQMINNGTTKFLESIGVGKDAMKWVKQHQISPKQLDNLFDSYMGVLYDMGLRPFSQRGASIAETKANPKEAITQWASSTFGTAFVVNGTLSSSRRTEVYSKLDSYYKQLDGLKKGTDEYNEVQMQITKLKNNVTYDMTTLDTAIDQINRNKKLSQKDKAYLTTMLKREQNSIMDDFNDGKNKVHDPLEYLLNMKDKNGKKVFTTEQVIKNFTYTNDNGDNTIRDTWNYLKESDYYKKHPKKAEKEFLNLTLETRKVAAKCNESKSFMDYTTMAVISESKKKDTGKGYDHILDSYGVGKGQTKMADIYVNQMGGDTKTYTASHRHIVEGAEELGLYTSKLKDHDYAMILANARTKNGNKLKDRAYFIEDINSWGNASYAYERMNPARCLSDEKYEKSNWSYKKVHKFAKANHLDYKSSDETIVKAIDKKYPNKTREEKAALFEVIKPTDNNPYGKIGDYSLPGDSGYDSDSGKGGGRRGRGRRGHGGGGGGGGKSSFTPVVNTAGQKAKVTNTSKKNHTSKSNLDDAYRKRLKKLREATR